MLDVGGRCSARYGSSSQDPQTAAVTGWSGKYSAKNVTARSKESPTAAGRERTGLRDVDVEHPFVLPESRSN